MKSYLVLWFNSEGKKSSEITKRLMAMGFRPTQGNFDYEYNWRRNPAIEEVFSLSDKVQESLHGCNVYFKVESQ